MKLTSASLDRVKSTAIPMLSALGGIVATLGYLQLSQVQDLGHAVDDIWTGLGLIFKGVMGAAGIIGPLWMSFARSSKVALVARVQASPTEQVVTTDPAVKAAVPDVKLAPS